jgi:uncharacterized protein YerC
MVNPFEQTPAEKEENVLDMVRRGYSYQQIMKACHVSPNDITRIKREHGLIGNNTSNNAGKISKEKQALIMFGKGKGLFEVATELDIDADEVFVIYQKFQRLRENETFISKYEHVKGNIQPYLHMFDLMNDMGMTPQQVGQLAGYGIRLPYLWNIYSKLCNDIQIMESQKRYLGLQLYNAQIQLARYKASLEFYYKECVMKRNDLLAINYEIDTRKKLVQLFDNDEGHQRIKKETAEQTKSIIKSNSLLIAVSVSSSLEAIRRYPRNQQLFYDLSASEYSTCNQQTCMQSHMSELAQLSEQVQNGIIESIAASVISTIKSLPRVANADY